jgi:hypothetical protein
MISIPLGRITVATAGTPVPVTLTSPQLAKTQSGLVASIVASADPASAGNVFVKQAGSTIAAIPPPNGGHAEHWETPECDGNAINPTVYSLDAATNGDGAFVTLWVE